MLCVLDQSFLCQDTALLSSCRHGSFVTGPTLMYSRSSQFNPSYESLRSRPIEIIWKVVGHFYSRFKVLSAEYLYKVTAMLACHPTTRSLAHHAIGLQVQLQYVYCPSNVLPVTISDSAFRLANVGFCKHCQASIVRCAVSGPNLHNNCSSKTLVCLRYPTGDRWDHFVHQQHCASPHAF